MAKMKRLTMQSVNKGIKQLELSHLAGGNIFQLRGKLAISSKDASPPAYLLTQEFYSYICSQEK